MFQAYVYTWVRGQHVQLFVTLWTVALQAPPSMGFPRQEYWSGLLFPSLGDLPEPGIKLTSPAWQVDSLPLSHLGSPTFAFSMGKIFYCIVLICIPYHKSWVTLCIICTYGERSHLCLS